MASGKIDSLWVELGVKGVGQATLTDFIKGLGAVKMSSLAAGGALATLFGWVGESTSAAVAFQSFSNATALSTDQLQLWQNAAVLANDSTENMTSAVTTLQQRLQAIKMGKFDPAFFKLGVVPGKTAETFDVLRRVMGRRGTMSAADYSAFVSELGLGGIQNTLAAGPKGLKGAESVEIMTPEQIAANLAFMREFKDLWLDVRALTRDIATESLPLMGTILEGWHNIFQFIHDAKNSKGDLTVDNAAGLWRYAFGSFGDPKAMLQSLNAPGAGGPIAARNATVAITLTGDRADEGLARYIAAETAAAIGTAADQIPVESPDNFIIPGVKKGK